MIQVLQQKAACSATKQERLALAMDKKDSRYDSSCEWDDDDDEDDRRFLWIGEHNTCKRFYCRILSFYLVFCEQNTKNRKKNVFIVHIFQWLINNVFIVLRHCNPYVYNWLNISSQQEQLKGTFQRTLGAEKTSKSLVNEMFIDLNANSWILCLTELESGFHH